MANNFRTPTFFLSSLVLFSYSLIVFSNAANTIKQGQSIGDGETVISSGENFVLGFFSPENSTNRYVGIWYNKVSIQTVVWVANRENPISDTTGVLTIGEDGNLVVLNGSRNPIWSTNASISSNTTATLMDSGNLVLASSDNMTHPGIWESFEYPTDTFLPGMRVTDKHIFVSWKSANDPAKGNYSMGVDLQGSLQIVIWEGSKRIWRSGQWNGLTFAGVPNTRALYLYGFKVTNDEREGKMYLTYTMLNSSEILKFRINWNGSEEQRSWDEERKEWSLVMSQPSNKCEVYNKCGNFGSCSITDSPICICVEGFKPKFIEEWNRGNWSGGCVRKTQLQCQRNSSVEAAKEDGFLKFKRMKLPDFGDSVTVQDTDECEAECLKNCSCGAYAYVIGMGCMIWGRDLVDLQHFQQFGSSLFIRLADSELGGNRKISKILIIVFTVLGTTFLSIFIWLLWRFRAKIRNPWKKGSKEQSLFVLSKSREFSSHFSGPDDLVREGNQDNGPELPLFNFNTVAVATNNFSDENKLGEGGFGAVYKGQLPSGQEIAVKRLSRKSGQGVEEFKNEIIMIAKLQHRNLVRLLGCCIQGEEKMLLYEYMPNKSLDSFLFDPTKKGQLDWKKRFNIIEGIARGLLYLHRDSRLRIIHRDLKAGNILLDEEMNPKISDFGMARIFGGNQNQANTNRVVGTYGYMSPEYAMEGLFSVKSDVYSFGVLLLEILSGQKNTSFRHPQHSSNLIGYAWNLWNEGKAMEFMDTSISFSEFEVLRCIHVALLCVQDSAMERPTMSSVILMLESETASLPRPKQPTFTIVRNHTEMDLCTESPEIVSTNDVTVTMVFGR